MFVDSPLIAASLIAARPAKGRAVPERQERAAYPRYVKIVAPRPSSRVVPVNDLYHRAAAARLRIMGLRERQRKAGVIWNDQVQVVEKAR